MFDPKSVTGHSQIPTETAEQSAEKSKGLADIVHQGFLKARQAQIDADQHRLLLEKASVGIAFLQIHAHSSVPDSDDEELAKSAKKAIAAFLDS